MIDVMIPMGNIVPGMMILLRMLAMESIVMPQAADRGM